MSELQEEIVTAWINAEPMKGRVKTVLLTDDKEKTKNWNRVYRVEVKLYKPKEE